MEIEKATPLFEEFERDYKRRHRSSIPQRPRISSWGLIGGIGLWSLIATGAALVSGAHSIPAILQTLPAIVTSPLREYLSLFGFTILELLIFAGAMYRRESRFALWALGIAMIGALAANVGSSVYSVILNGGDVLSLIVAIILALVAPLAAFLAGEMIHLLHQKHDAALAAAKEIFNQKARDLEAIINREYNRLYKPVASKRSVQQVSIGQSASSSIGHTKVVDATVRVQEHLDAHPEDLNLKPRALAAKLGVGKSTANNVQRERKGQGGYTNGHGEQIQ